MKIKLTESQFINIIKNQIVESKDSDLGNNALIKAFSAMSDIYSDGNDLFKRIVNGDFGDFDGSMFNPNFDASSAIPEDFEKIDIWPINNTKINSPFGPRNIGRGASKNHGGVDLNAKVGTPIYSPANGVVRAARDTTPNACGGFVKINHGKYTTKYCHLIKFDVVKKGDKVVKGQLIGYTGGAKGGQYAGNSLGPHLHYEVLIGGKHVDPERVHGRLS